MKREFHIEAFYEPWEDEVELSDEEIVDRLIGKLGGLGFTTIDIEMWTCRDAPI